MSKQVLVRRLQARDTLPITRLHLSLTEQDRCFYHPFPFRPWKVTLILTIMFLSSRVSRLTRVILPKATFLPLVAIDTAKGDYAGFTYLQLQKRRADDKYTATLGIVVAEGYRNSGIASQLMNELVHLAEEIEVAEINLTVMADNESAIRLYQGFGFTTVDTEKEELWNGKFYPHHDMKLALLDNLSDKESYT